MAIREGKWKCPSCTTVNRGAVQQCAQCGTTRDANVKFFLDEDAAEVTDAAQLAKAQSGADWICEFCGNTSPQASAICTGCGAPKTEKQRKSGDVVPVGGHAPVAPPALPQQPKPPGQGAKLGLAGMLAILLMLLSCCVCMWFQVRTQAETATVALTSWQRTVDVEDFLPVKEAAWGSAPQGAYEVTQRREQSGTQKVQRGTRTEHSTEKYQSGSRKVKTGSRDLGNGHFEDVYKDEPIYSERRVSREVPVYVEEPVFGQRFYYTIDRWKVVRTPVAKGGATETPAWPDLQLNGKERKGTARETYLVVFKGTKVPEKTMKAPTEAEWAKFKPGSTWNVEFNNAGDYKVLDAGGQLTGLVKADGASN